MKFLDTILGRTKPKPANLDALFAVDQERTPRPLSRSDEIQPEPELLELLDEGHPGQRVPTVPAPPAHAARRREEAHRLPVP